jgi:hypothetical protein
LSDGKILEDSGTVEFTEIGDTIVRLEDDDSVALGDAPCPDECGSKNCYYKYK